MRNGSELIILGLGLLCLGCGGDAPFDYVKVSGKLTYDDGSPIPTGGIQLKFFAEDAPQVEGAKPRPAIAHVGEDGSFDLATSYKYGDGLIPGKHRVAILYAKDKQGKSLIPKDYSRSKKTPLVVDTDNIPFEIKVPKP